MVVLSIGFESGTQGNNIGKFCDWLGGVNMLTIINHQHTSCLLSLSSHYFLSISNTYHVHVGATTYIWLDVYVHEKLAVYYCVTPHYVYIHARPCKIQLSLRAWLLCIL